MKDHKYESLRRIVFYGSWISWTFSFFLALIGLGPFSVTLVFNGQFDLGK
jgi:hypothetical protein